MECLAEIQSSTQIGDQELADYQPAGSYAPAAAKFITQEAHADLSAEQSLGLLTTGLLKNTVTAAVGVLSTAVADTDYQAASAKLAAIAALTWAADKTLKLTGTGTLTTLDLLFNTYTPTLSNTTNIAASTANLLYYFRFGDYVFVFGSVQIDPTTAGVASLLGMSLPIASNFTSATQSGGAASSTTSDPAAITTDSANDRFSFIFTPADNANRNYFFFVGYPIL